MSALPFITVLAFSGGLFAALPGGEALLKLLLIAMAGFVVLSRAATPIDRSALVLVWPYLAYMLLAFCSGIATTGSPLFTLLALQPFVLGLLLYFSILLVDVRSTAAPQLRRLAFAIFAAQIVFVFVKLLVHGIDEKVLIGTMSHAAGQLGFLFPAIALPILMHLRHGYPARGTYLLVALVFAFGIINEKRSVIYLLPLILLAGLAVARSQEPGAMRKIVGSGLLAAIFSICAVVLGSAFIPSLNPAAAYGGSISVAHIWDYAITYLFMDYGGDLQGSYLQAITDENVQVGRFILWAATIRWLVNQPLAVMLFGNGFGSATPSEWLGSGYDPLFDIIGTRGAISGAGLALIETGLVGFLLLSYFIFSMLRAARRARREVTTNWARRWLLGLFVIWGVFCYDFFFYSTTLLRTLPMPLFFFGSLASISVVQRWDARSRQTLSRRAAAAHALPA